MALTILAEWDLKAPELPIDNWWFIAVVLVLLILFIWLIARLTTSVTDDIDPAEIDRQMLTAVSELHSQGELSPDEFRSIKGRLVELLSDKPSPDDAAGSPAQTRDTQLTQGRPHSTTEKPLEPTGSADSSSETSAADLQHDSPDVNKDMNDTMT